MRRALLRYLVLLTTIMLARQAMAQQQVISERADNIAITIYHAPDGADGTLFRGRPRGYALITEERIVSLPAGETQIRFEGVAEGLLPETAVIEGLPEGVKEKNRDARLLSPSGLIDAYLKRAVSIIRTNPATGNSQTFDALITAGPDGGVVLETDEGFEAWRCSGLPERMSYPSIPANLSAKPTLSVMTISDQPISIKLKLTYLAEGFDWRADYIAQVRDTNVRGKKSVNLFAWLTIANGGNQSFSSAHLNAVAGNPARNGRSRPPAATGRKLNLSCWPMQKTHEVPLYERNIPEVYARDRANDPPLVEEITVTAARNILSDASPALVAEQEDLGDLKLYRIPEPIDINAKGQKQIAMLGQDKTSFYLHYAAEFRRTENENSGMSILLESRNRKDHGLGLPMPAGNILVFEEGDSGPLLTGRDRISDRAIGELISVTAGYSSNVRIRASRIMKQNSLEEWTITLTNAHRHAVRAKVAIPYQLIDKHPQVEKIDGIPTWETEIPANGEISLTSRISLIY